MNKELIVFANGVQVRTDKQGNVSLTDLHAASKASKGMNPAKWQETESAKAFIEATSQILNIPATDIIKSKRGKGGGTYANKQIALAYAKYLSPELHYAVNQVFFERLEEEKDPQKALDRAQRSWKKQGKTDEWISKRFQSIATRNVLTSTLSQHGVTTVGFRDCTNAIYTPLYGGGAELVREKKGLPANTNTREHMSEIELAAVQLAELLAAQNIEEKKLQGNKPCEYECYSTSRDIAKAIIANKKRLPARVA